MAWSNSKVFTSYLTDVLNNTTAIDLNSDALLEVALYDNTITPDQTVTSANSAYAAGVWASGHQLSGTSWPSLGRPLVSPTSTFATNVFTFDAADTASADATCTLSGTYGCLLYDHSIASPVADQGLAFLYFGGVATITSGTFTVVWNTSGLFTLTA
jgi:hypothetical protein